MTHGQSTSREPDSAARWSRRERLSDPIPVRPASPFEDRFSTIRVQWRTAHVPTAIDAVETLEPLSNAVVERQGDDRDTGRQRRQIAVGHERS